MEISPNTLFASQNRDNTKDCPGDYLTLEDNTKIWYENTAGKQPAFVFVHGNVQNHTTFSKLRDEMKSKGHGVLWYDLAGHGRSEAYPTKDYDMKKLTDTLENVLDASMIKKPILVGHSMGGMIVLQYAVDHPENISGLVLIGASYMNPVRANTKIPLMIILSKIIGDAYKISDPELCGVVYPFNENPQLPEKKIWSTGLKYTVPMALEGNFGATREYDVCDKLGRLDVPTLILRGEQDLLVTDEMVEDTQSRIRNSKMVTIPGYGHNFQLQRPDLLVENVERNYDLLVGKK